MLLPMYGTSLPARALYLKIQWHFSERKDLENWIYLKAFPHTNVPSFLVLFQLIPVNTLRDFRVDSSLHMTLAFLLGSMAAPPQALAFGPSAAWHFCWHYWGLHLTWELAPVVSIVIEGAFPWDSQMAWSCMSVRGLSWLLDPFCILHAKERTLDTMHTHAGACMQKRPISRYGTALRRRLHHYIVKVFLCIAVGCELKTQHFTPS